jgi:Domain of unknown function (DUF1929)
VTCCLGDDNTTAPCCQTVPCSSREEHKAKGSTFVVYSRVQPSQRINVLDFDMANGRLQVSTPDSPNVCPPGFYMSFILNSAGVPSVAKILQIQTSLVSRAAMRGAGAIRGVSRRLLTSLTRRSHAKGRAMVSVVGKGTRVVVGLNSTCPYRLGACWGGAHEALSHLDAVDVVNPIASSRQLRGLGPRSKPFHCKRLIGFSGTTWSGFRNPCRLANTKPISG